MLPAGSRTGEMATLEFHAHQEVQGPGRVWKFLKHSMVSERLVTSSLIRKVGGSQESQGGLHSATGQPASWSGPAPQQCPAAQVKEWSKQTTGFEVCVLSLVRQMKQKCNTAMELRTLVKGLCMQYGILPG